MVANGRFDQDKPPRPEMNLIRSSSIKRCLSLHTNVGAQWFRGTSLYWTGCFHNTIYMISADKQNHKCAKFVTTSGQTITRYLCFRHTSVCIKIILIIKRTLQVCRIKGIRGIRQPHKCHKLDRELLVHVMAALSS